MRVRLEILLLSIPVFAASPYYAMVHYANIPATAPSSLYADASFSISPVASTGQPFATDASGNFYIVHNITEPSGRRQIRVDKVDTIGNPVADFEFGGSGADFVAGIAIDQAGDLVIVGSTLSSDFPLVSPLITTPEMPAAFITKIDSQMSKILFSTELGGTQDYTAAAAVALDKSGNIYVTGETYDTDFPVTPNAFQKSPPQTSSLGPAEYAFVTAISANGKSILFATYYGDSAISCPNGSQLCPVAETSATAIALDASGDPIIAGTTNAAHLPVTQGTFGVNCGDCGDSASAGFFAKFSPDGAQLLWGTFLPVVSSPEAGGLIQITALTLDASGNLIAGGNTSSVLPVTPGALQRSFSIYPNLLGFAGFVMEADPTAQHLLFCTYFGVEDPLTVSGLGGIVVDLAGSIWVSGASLTAKLPGELGTPVLGEDYLAALSSDGTTLIAIFTAPSGAAGLGIALAENSVTALGASGSLLTVSQGSAPSLVAVTNSAGGAVSSALAPRELISLYGLGIGPLGSADAQVVNNGIGNAIDGVQVLFDGIPAPLLYAGPTQLNAVVPNEIFGHDTTMLKIVTPSGILDGPTMQVRPSQPGVALSAVPNSGVFPAPAAAMNQDGSVNSVAHPAALGSIVSVWVSGAGLSDLGSADGSINTIAGVPILPVIAFSTSPFEFIFGAFQLDTGHLSLEVYYAGDAVGMVAGVTQVNFRLPPQVEELNIGNSVFWLQIGDATSEPFSLYVKSPLSAE
jgi:uncharacterized protein (TIGR03437 family)